MKFYDPNGKEIDVSTFVTLYNSLYYKGKNKEEYNPKLPSAVSSNNEDVERIFDELLKTQEYSKTNYRDIMAWKLGAINQEISSKDKKDNKVKLAFNGAGWDDFGKQDPKLRSGALKLEKLLNYLTEDLDEKYKSPQNLEAVEIAQEFLNSLKNEDISGLGPVYMITLLYFQSKGYWPIYDRFAAIALLAIKKGVKPDWYEEDKDGKIVYIEPPSKDSKQFKKVVERLLQPFRSQINEVFRDDGGYEKYHKSRDIDRALWVYGHLFNTKQWLFDEE